MAHSLASYLRAGNLNSAAVADLSLKAYFLELSAVAFPVFSRSENSFTVKTVPFRLLGSVIYSFRTLNSAVRSATDLFR